MSTQSTITREEKRRRLHEALGGGDEWIIIKDGFFYRPNAAGYTSNINDAGRYTRKEAELREFKHGAPREWVHIEQAPSPDYFGSLDAVHEAEKTCLPFTAKALHAYCETLFGLCVPAHCKRDPGWHFAIHATAAQRAEALGLALGLWKEGE